MLYKYGKHKCDFMGRFSFYLVLFAIFIYGGVFNQTIISLTLVGYETIIANTRSWNYC